MKATTFDPKVVARGEHATGHVRDLKDGRVKLPFDVGEFIAPMNPGGGAWSTLSDLLKVMAMELANGKTAKGKQAFPRKELLARREPQARNSENTSYGLALDVRNEWDVRAYGHGGSLPGFGSYMFFLPDHGVAVVILTNAGTNPLIGALGHKIWEVLFDGRDEAREDLALALKSHDEDYAKRVAKIDLTPDPAFLERFAGAWEHALYGKITIRMEGKGAVLDAGEWRASVGRRREDDGTEKLVGAMPPWVGWPALVRKESGGKVHLEMRDGQRKVVFERR
jgi:hypothetical protein